MEPLVAAKKYQGKYVAFDPDKGKTVIAYGKNVGKVIEKARKKGVECPAIAFVPEEGVTYIYHS